MFSKCFQNYQYYLREYCISTLPRGGMYWVVQCTSPTTKRFPETREMSRGPSPRAKPEGHIAISGNTFTIIFNIHSLYLTMSTQLQCSWQYWTMLCCIWQYFCHTLLYSSNIGQYSCYNLQYPVNIFHSLSLTIPTTMQLLILCNDLQF